MKITDTLMNEELEEEIIKLIHNELHNEYSYIDKLQQDYRNEIHAYSEATKSITEKLRIIEEMIQRHAIGVQNVYDEVMKIKNAYNITKIDENILDKIKYCME